MAAIAMCGTFDLKNYGDLLFPVIAGHEKQLAVLVVGNAKEFDKPLSSLGAVKEINITIPPPPGGNPQKAPSPPQ